jgi:hypothetical protein
VRFPPATHQIAHGNGRRACLVWPSPTLLVAREPRQCECLTMNKDVCHGLDGAVSHFCFVHTEPTLRSASAAHPAIAVIDIPMESIVGSATLNTLVSGRTECLPYFWDTCRIA